jgi:hypothetical protein
LDWGYQPVKRKLREKFSGMAIFILKSDAGAYPATQTDRRTGSNQDKNEKQILPTAKDDNQGIHRKVVGNERCEQEGSSAASDRSREALRRVCP